MNVDLRNAVLRQHDYFRKHNGVLRNPFRKVTIVECIFWNETFNVVSLLQNDYRTAEV